MDIDRTRDTELLREHGIPVGQRLNATFGPGEKFYTISDGVLWCAVREDGTVEGRK